MDDRETRLRATIDRYRDERDELAARVAVLEQDKAELREDVQGLRARETAAKAATERRVAKAAKDARASREMWKERAKAAEWQLAQLDRAARRRRERATA